MFEDITAEGADLKEGTDSGTLRRNVFRRAGTSGQNSADSAVDAKGNNWVIEDNVVSETDAAVGRRRRVARRASSPTASRSHSVYDGYGTGNVFRRNHVDGAIPGFGIGLYPALDNVVTCDNARSRAPRWASSATTANRPTVASRPVAGVGPGRGPGPSRSPVAGRR